MDKLKGLSPQEFEDQYLNRSKSGVSRAHIKEVLQSSEEIFRIFSPDKAVETQVQDFYEQAFNSAFSRVPRKGSDADDPTLKVLSAIRRFKEDHVIWGNAEFRGAELAIDFKKVDRQIKAVLSAMPPSNGNFKESSLLYLIAKDDPEAPASILTLLLVATTRRFAAISLTGGIARLSATELGIGRPGTHEDLIAWYAEMNLADHISGNQYLRKVSDVLDSEGMTKVGQLTTGMKPGQSNRIVGELDNFLFPNMPPLTLVELKGRESLHTKSLYHHFAMKKKGWAGALKEMQRMHTEDLPLTHGEV